MPGSLQAVTDWHRVAQSAEWVGGRSAPLAGLLFANKTDLTCRRLVSTEAGSQLAAKLGLHYIEGSAVCTYFIFQHELYVIFVGVIFLYTGKNLELCGNFGSKPGNFKKGKRLQKSLSRLSCLRKLQFCSVVNGNKTVISCGG